jgi:hypothetical protein
MDNHVGLVVADLDPLVEKLRRDGVPFFTRCNGAGACFAPNATRAGGISGGISGAAGAIGAVGGGVSAGDGDGDGDDDYTVDVFMEAPGGIILEALGPSTLLRNVTAWDLCGPLSKYW